MVALASPEVVGPITPCSRKIRARWEELKCVTEGFVTCCEHGNFSPLKERAAAANGER